MTLTAFPNDRERDVRSYLKKRLKLLGGELRKCSWFPRANAPDEIVFLPARANRPARVVWIELKRPGKRPGTGQQRELDRLAEHGELVAVVDCREAVDAVLFW